jgi:hypothetical protein
LWWSEWRRLSDLLASAGINQSVSLEFLDEHRPRCADHARAARTLIVLSERLEWASKQRPND